MVYDPNNPMTPPDGGVAITSVPPMGGGGRPSAPPMMPGPMAPRTPTTRTKPEGAGGFLGGGLTPGGMPPMPGGGGMPTPIAPLPGSPPSVPGPLMGQQPFNGARAGGVNTDALRSFIDSYRNAMFEWIQGDRTGPRPQFDTQALMAALFSPPAPAPTAPPAPPVPPTI